MSNVFEGSQAEGPQDILITVFRDVWFIGNDFTVNLWDSFFKIRIVIEGEGLGLWVPLENVLDVWKRNWCILPSPTAPFYFTLSCQHRQFLCLMCCNLTIEGFLGWLHHFQNLKLLLSIWLVIQIIDFLQLANFQDWSSIIDTIHSLWKFSPQFPMKRCCFYHSIY